MASSFQTWCKTFESAWLKKPLKVSKVRSKYSEWWLAFDDRIGYGDLDKADRNQLRKLVQLDVLWSKIILVNPLTPSDGFEM